LQVANGQQILLGQVALGFGFPGKTRSGGDSATRTPWPLEGGLRFFLPFRSGRSSTARTSG
jgi:hypothetical protein